MTPSLTPLSLRANISYVMKPFLQTPPTAPEAVIFSHHSITTSFLYMLLYLCQENGGSQRTNLIFLCSPPYPWGLEYTQYVIAKHSLNECREIKGRHLEMRKKKGTKAEKYRQKKSAGPCPQLTPSASTSDSLASPQLHVDPARLGICSLPPGNPRAPQVVTRAAHLGTCHMLNPI